MQGWNLYTNAWENSIQKSSYYSEHLITSVTYNRCITQNSLAFPNPVHDAVILLYPAGQIVIITIYDASGILIISYLYPDKDGQSRIGFDAYIPGVYFYSVRGLGDRMHTGKIIKKQAGKQSLVTLPDCTPRLSLTRRLAQKKLLSCYGNHRVIAPYVKTLNMKKVLFGVFTVVAFVFACLPAISQEILWNNTPKKGFVYEISNKEAQKLLDPSRSKGITSDLLHMLADTFNVQQGWTNRPSKGHYIMVSIIGNKLHCEYTCIFPYQVFLLQEYNV